MKDEAEEPRGIDTITLPQPEPLEEKEHIDDTLTEQKSIESTLNSDRASTNSLTLVASAPSRHDQDIFMSPFESDHTTPLPSPSFLRIRSHEEEASVHGLDPQHTESENLTVTRIFKKSVERVVDDKRMWVDLWSELDKAEETDLMTQFLGKQDLLNNMSPIVSIPTSPKSKSSEKKPEHTEEDRAKRRLSYIRKTSEHSLVENDIYNPEDYPKVPASFLWEVSSKQDAVRRRINIHPEGGERRGDYVVADIEPIIDGMPITGEWISRLIEELKLEKIIPYTVAYQIVCRSIRTCLPLDNVVNVKVQNADPTVSDEIAVIGDLHGQLDDLLMVFREAGCPWDGKKLLFNGDFVDRGEYSCEVALVLLACRAAFPDRVFLNRGNHEAEDMNSLDGFMAEALKKYDEHLWKLINAAFATLPIAHLIELPTQRVFVVHAGLSFVNFTIDQANKENRFLPYFKRNTLIQDLLWSDPYEGRGRIHSKRGAGCQFGADVAEQFFRLNRVSLIIRSHECEDHGYKLWFENRLYTIFSASNYCGDTDNYGAYCILSSTSKVPQIRLFIARRQVIKYSERQQRARQATIAKMLVRLVGKINEVESTIKEFAARESYNKLKGRDVDTVESIGVSAWSAALEISLNIRIPFRRIASRLGINLTSIEPGETKNVRINIQKWCNRFKPRPSSKDSLLSQKVSTLIYHPSSPFRAALEELFHHFDVNKDGTITPEEFKEGVSNLLTTMSSETGTEPITWTEEEMNELVLKADSNEDGEIDYNEFFSVFAFGNVDLEAVDEDVEYL